MSSIRIYTFIKPVKQRSKGMPVVRALREFASETDKKGLAIGVLAKHVVDLSTENLSHLHQLNSSKATHTKTG